MPRQAVALATTLILLAGCTLPWGKKDEPIVPGTHIGSKIHGYTAVIPEGWVPLESNPFSFPDPDPFPGQADRQIFVRPEPRAVLCLDVMLNPSDGQTVLPEKSSTAKVGELLAAILHASRGKGDSAPRIVMNGKDLTYDFTRSIHSGYRSHYVGMVRPRTAGGFIVVAIVGDSEDASLEAEMVKTRDHLKVD